MCILRFIALFALYSEFCVRASGEGSAGDWEQVAPAGLLGEYPLVDAFSLGQLAQQRDMFVNNGPGWPWDQRKEVITLQAKVEYRQVLETLQDHWGKKELFTALCASRGTRAAAPSPCDDRRGRAFSTISKAGMRRAWKWYDAGASLER